MRTKETLSILLVLLSSFAYSQNQQAVLNKAYRKQSLKQLDRFFQTWTHEILPISAKELTKENDTIQNIYQLYSTFYRPTLDTKFPSDTEDVTDSYAKIPYVVLDNSIVFSFTDKLYYDSVEINDYVTRTVNKNIKSDSTKKEILKYEGHYSPSIIYFFGPNSYSLFYNEVVLHIDTIKNFRPAVNTNKNIVFFTKEYQRLLKEFIGNDIKKIETEDSSYFTGESFSKIQFLSNYIKVSPAHWVGWKFQTFPLIYKITFDKDMQYAKLYFKIKYQYGEALYKKSNNIWTLVFAERTAVE